MFTGLIETTGVVTTIFRENRSLVMGITPQTDPYDVSRGDSVAINGVCLTVERSRGRELFFRAVFETVASTTLGTVSHGGVVNMERALAVGGRLDGHIVQGHVDTQATLVEIRPVGDSFLYGFDIPAAHEPYIVSKGSVAIDGISLTIARQEKGRFWVSVIPVTMEETNLHCTKIHNKVNIECDILARYVERLLRCTSKDDEGRGDTGLMNLLQRSGF
ncbi:riboflavin synthase [Chitinivibrio alkaliphilus]|uniref:Riboflavin synthase n=1 Tax=Chitinivibrio alkaliphilus ACht1 TaxID=1313304 RepID=U7DCR2_9BACT|nr:riboflavin synthase [Chitinivibrio alkaliphilus]ERP38686.1 riboflavin synthase subunit alpha [Chitinivibrio alkaliphilus ACht1]